jgi:hypothetical protein
MREHPTGKTVPEYRLRLRTGVRDRTELERTVQESTGINRFISRTKYI